MSTTHTETRQWLALIVMALAVLLLLLLFRSIARATPSHAFTGTITRVGEDQLSIDVQGIDLSFAVAPEAIITIDGDFAMLDDLQAGDEARIDGERLDDGMRLAMRVAALSRDHTEVAGQL